MALDVRGLTFDVLRAHGLTTLFGNPGSTEISLLTDLPNDLTFILGLHEGSVVGMATGWAIAHERPAAVILHTTAGLGNAVGALATARVNRAPLVVIIGQQDRRHLAFEPFLTGRLDGLAGDYPVWVGQPTHAADVPGAVGRAVHEARTGHGPALVIVPMDDWTVPVEEGATLAAPDVVRSTARPDPDVVAELADLVNGASNPAIVVGSGADSPAAWTALTALADRLSCPVWQEAFGARAGFPQDHPRFAGHLPAGRAALRQALSGHDLVLTVGAPIFRQYHFEPGPLLPPGTRAVVISQFAEEIHRSPAELAVHADPGLVCAALVDAVTEHPEPAEPIRRKPVPIPPYEGLLLPEHVFTELAERLAPDTILVEESPSSRPLLHELVPAREPLGFVSAAMGGLGFGLPAATGLKMALPHRPVVAVMGDGSSIYGIQALWSAAHYGVGALFVVMSNGAYAIMDWLASEKGHGKAPWPQFTEVSMSGLATSLGCPAIRVTDLDGLREQLDAIVPTLGERTEPLLLDVAVGTL
ncbi:benzoylformate decarboxylase [Actinomadura meridiana]|uniref:Benzoylformate decarboxylase n=1 Tax=Actinomadura meridiana TaxID=559626 RepID=A0ABP8C266_9ACTN